MNEYLLRAFSEGARMETLRALVPDAEARIREAVCHIMPGIPEPIVLPAAQPPAAEGRPEPRVGLRKRRETEVQTPPSYPAGNLESYPPPLRVPRSETSRLCYDAIADGPKDFDGVVDFVREIDNRLSEHSVRCSLRRLKLKGLVYSPDGQNDCWRLV